MPAAEPVILRLPFPPSVNGYWERASAFGKGGRRVPAMRIGKRGRQYRTAVMAAVNAEMFRRRLRGFVNDERLRIDIVLSPPDRRRRDIDNYNKALWDALVHAGLFADDSQIDEARITRGPVIKGGAAFIRLAEQDTPDVQSWAQQLMESEHV